MGSYLIRFREIFAGLFFAVAVLLISYFGIYRLFERNRNTLNSIQEAILDRKIREEQVLRIPEMKQDLEFIDTNNSLSRALISKDEVVPLVEQVESLGGRSGVTVISEAASIRPNSAEAVSEEGADSGQRNSGAASHETAFLGPLLPEERSIRINFKVTGRYGNIISFLEKLDSFPVLLDVLSIDMIPQPDENSVQSAKTSRPTLVFGDSKEELSLKPGQSDTEGIAGEKEQIRALFSAVLYLKR